MGSDEDDEIEIMPEENDFCRLCLLEMRSEEMADIFHTNNKTSLKIMACTGMEVHPEDSLPRKICYSCSDLLTIFYAFRKKCKSSDTKYRRFLRLHSGGKIENIAELSDDEGDEEYAVALSDYNEKQNQVLEAQIRNAEEKLYEKFEKEKQTLLQEEKLRVYREEKQKIQEKAMRQIVATLKQNEKYEKDGKSLGKTKNVRIINAVCEDQDKEDNVELEVIWTNDYEDKEESVASQDNYSVSVLSDDEYNGHEIDESYPNKDEQIEEKPTDLKYKHIYIDTQNHEPVEYEYVEPDDHSRHGSHYEGVHYEVDEKSNQTLAVFNSKSEHFELDPDADSVIYLEVEQQKQQTESKFYDSKGNLVIFKCSKCPKTFARNDDLKNHEGSHKKRKGFSCIYCEKWFSSNSSRLRHERIHTGEKPFECHVCGKKFVQKEILKRHVVVHSGQKPFQCGQCDKQFTQKEVLRQHINRKHTENPVIQQHKCFLCPKEFRHASGLSRHLLAHAGRTFPCEVCGKNFGDKSALKRHMNTIHKETTTT
ncbi:zinc finger and BTB domain-containing protein 17 [Sergentomyia squamirostris]